MRACVTLSLLALGCRGGAPDMTAPRAPSLTLAVDDPASTETPRVRLGVTRQLYARLAAPSLPVPVAWVTLELYTPTGALHQRRWVPFATGPSAPRAAAHEGVSDPIDVQPARAIAGGWLLELAQPVGGTNLERRPQPGTWRVHAAVEGRPDVTFDSAVEMGSD